MVDASSILDFRSITTAPDPSYDTHLENFSLTLNPGDMGLIRFDRHAPRNPLPDAAMGLAELNKGEVRFKGDSWADLSPRLAGRFRGHIGRFFGEHGWVNHLDVDENITLRQRHHSRRSLGDIENEAESLAKSLGLEQGLPRVRPTLVDPRDLQLAACVRMLMGQPPLLVVDEPPSGLYSDVLTVLALQLEKVRARGGAVLWLSADPFVWADVSHRPTRRVDLTDRKTAAASLASG